MSANLRNRWRWKLGVTILGATVISGHAALAVLTTDNTNIGKHPNYNTSFSGFWRTGVDYSVLTDGANTYINAPSSTGDIHFRRANVGVNGNLDIATFESSGECEIRSAGSYALFATVSGGTDQIAIQGNGGLTGVYGQATQANGSGVRGYSGGSAAGVFGSSVTGNGVSGASGGVFPNAGVNGSNSAAGGIAIIGSASNTTNSMGVFGSGATTGVQGLATAAVNGTVVPWGVSGVANGSGGHAIDAICNGSCDSSAANTTNPGLAGHFGGNVQVDGTNATTGYPWALNLTKGSAAKPGGGMWEATTSDQRTKKDVRAFEPGLTEILQVRPVRYRFNGLAGTRDDGTEYVGVIAQELEKVLPFMVTSRKGKLRKDDTQETMIKGVDPSAFTYALINAVKEQHELIKQQEARIAALERGRAPLMSSVLSGGGITAGIALGLFPMGLIVAVRRRNKRAA